MLENVTKFFELYNADPALKARCREAESLYPGSLDIRESVVEDVLLPIAEELGLPFTVMDLRVYETKLKAYRERDERMTPEELADNESYEYWLIDHRWSYDYEGAIKDLSGK